MKKAPASKIPWKNDKELFALCRKQLFSAVIGDIMDLMDHRRQFLPPQIQPLTPDMVVVGRAMTVLEADDIGGESKRENPTLSRPFGLMLEALDALKDGEIYICSGSSPTYALWGELMSTRAMKRGAVGAVVNGYSRDTKGILKLGFPVFSYGRYAQDQRPRGKVLDFRCRIKVGDVEVNDGDLIFGDLDGVCVIPRAIETEVILRSLEKANGEKRVMKAIQGGMGAVEAWNKFGIM